MSHTWEATCLQYCQTQAAARTHASTIKRMAAQLSIIRADGGDVVVSADYKEAEPGRTHSF